MIILKPAAAEVYEPSSAILITKNFITILYNCFNFNEIDFYFVASSVSKV